MSKKSKNDGQGKYTYYKGSFVTGKKADGTPERVYIRGKTKAEFDEKMSEAKRLHARGLKAGEMTVYEWSERWMRVYKSTASTTQKAHYKAKLKHDILPVIGSMRMKDVRASHLQELLNAYSGGKKGTVEKIRHAICLLFADATYERIIEFDPAVRLSLPDMTEKPRRPLTEAERKAVLTVAETHPRGAYVLTMLYCGLRRGECLALTREDIDLENKRITVSKALSLNQNIGTLGGTKAAKMRKRAKTDESVGVRVVPIPDKLIPVLTDLCADKTPEVLLFPKDDGDYATLSTVDWWWDSFTRQCHIKAGAKLYRNKVLTETSPFSEDVTPHYLRHTYATDLYAAGVDEMARKIFLGHSNSDVTAGYTAMSDEAFNRNTGLINKYLSK